MPGRRASPRLRSLRNECIRIDETSHCRSPHYQAPPASTSERVPRTTGKCSKLTQNVANLGSAPQSAPLASIRYAGIFTSAPNYGPIQRGLLGPARPFEPSTARSRSTPNLCPRCRALFLCPRYRAGVCRRDRPAVGRVLRPVSMPSASGSRLQRLPFRSSPIRLTVSMRSVSGSRLQEPYQLSAADGEPGFYALGIGLAVAGHFELSCFCAKNWFLCPRYRARGCSNGARGVNRPGSQSFYALGIGLAVAALPGTPPHRPPRRFLCPRYRARGCRRDDLRLLGHAPSVSMPSVSGSRLQRNGRCCRAAARPRFYALGIGLAVAETLNAILMRG
jgi:hypothetical protein